MKRMISLWLGNQWDICFNVQPRNNAASSKGNHKEGCFLSLLSRVFRIGFSKVFCMSRTSWVCVLNYVVEAALLRTLTFRARWAMGIHVYWPHRRTPFGARFYPCFPDTDCSNGWSCPLLGGEQELEAVQPLECLVGGWSAGSPQACSSWKYCAWAVGSPSRETVEHVQASLHVVWLHPFVLLASFLSSGAPGKLAGSLSLVFQVYMQWIYVFPCRLFFAVSLAFLNSNGVGSSRKKFNNNIHPLVPEGPSPQNLDTRNET